MPIMNVECVYSDPDGGVPYNNQFQPLKTAVNNGKTLWDEILGIFMGNVDQ